MPVIYFNRGRGCRGDLWEQTVGIRHRLKTEIDPERDARLAARDHILLFRLVHFASTLPPTWPMTEMAAITIRPATKAYSRTSPP